MADILDTLIFDRTQLDVDRARYLNSLWDAQAGRWTGTRAEWDEWAAGPRGAYGWNDMNRVTEAVAYLAGELSALGYSVDLENVTPAYTIRVLAFPAEGGTASGAGVYYEGGTATVTAVAGGKYDFVGWMENGAIVSSEQVYTFTVERSRSLTAAFALKQFRVDVSVEPDGSGQASGAGVYDIDTEITVAASAGEGYVFTRWTEDGETVAEGPEYTFTLDRDRTLRAVMAMIHIISVSSSDSGGGTVSGSGTYLDGQTVTVAAVAGEGYEFAGWQEDGRVVSEEAVYSFPASADRELVGLFVRTHVVTLLVDPDGGGSAQGGGTYREGAQATVRAAPESDYRFVAWSEDGRQVSTDREYSFTVVGDRALTAVFELIPVYTVTAAIDPAGSGTVTGAGQYKEGETVTLKATVADGYQFTGWQENGQTVSAAAEYSFAAAGDRALVAVFAVKPSRLPAGYTEVEYIHWDGLKTSFVLKENVSGSTDRIFFRFYPESYGSSSTAQTMLLVNSSISGTIYFLQFSSKGTQTLSFLINTIGTNAPSITTNTVNVLLEFDIDFYNNKYTVNGTSLTGTKYSRSLGTTNKVLGCSPTSSTVSSPQGKFYQLTHYRNGAVIHDYVPCVNSSGVAGVFDINSSTFIQNTQVGKTGITPGPAI